MNNLVQRRIVLTADWQPISAAPLVASVDVSCLPQNRRMQRLARKFGAAITFDYDTVNGTMENPLPTPLSVMQEMVADVQSSAAAYVDFQSRLFRPVGALASLLPYQAARQVQ